MPANNRSLSPCPPRATFDAPGLSLTRGIASRAACLVALAAALAAAGPGDAHAQLGLVIGSEHGFGGFVRVGPRAIKLEAAAGVAPVLSVVATSLSVNGNTIEDEINVNLYLPFQYGGRVSIQLNGSDAEHRVGLRAGASYNELTRLGYGGGIDYGISGRTSLGLSFMYYSEAADRLGDKFYDEEISPAAKQYLSREDIELPEIFINYQIVLSLAFSLF
jgi:hypothetical protein